MHFDHRICGAAIYQSLKAQTPVSQSLTVRGLRARALLVTSGDNIFKMLGVQRLAMLTNGSACISTDRTCGATIYQSLRVPTPVSQSLTLNSDFSDNIFRTLGIQRLVMLTNDSACISTNRICGATFYQSLRTLTPVSQSLTVSVSEPEHF